jgi:Ca2+-binding EF-hand superfamily protein
MKRAAVTLVVVPLALFAAGCAGPRRHASASQEWHPPAEMLDKYADKKGVVTRAAMEAGLRADFAAVDKNHNGCLGEEEVRTINEARWKQDASTASPLIDFKHKGCIDFDEYAATPRSLFDQLDRDGDGKLTPKELHPGAQVQP